MFIIDITYKVSLEEIDTYMQPHVEYLDKYFAAGIFLIAGRKIPREGGIIMALGKTKSEMEEIVKEDPFYTNHLADIHVIEFSGGRRADNMQQLLEA